MTKGFSYYLLFAICTSPLIHLVCPPPPPPPPQVVQKVDNAIILINRYSVDNIIGFANNAYCWIVIYVMVFVIQCLNNCVQGMAVVPREIEDNVCLCKILGDKQCALWEMCKWQISSCAWWLFQDWNKLMIQVQQNVLLFE